MKIVEIIPITRGIFKESLTYFTAQDIKEGQIIDVPLRKKNIPALVVSSKDISSAKTQIKSADFKLRKISKTTQRELFHHEFITSAEETAKYFVAHTGDVLKSLVPKAILESEEVVNKTLPKKGGKISECIIQLPKEKRVEEIKDLISKEFKNKKSVLILTPTIQSAEDIFESLKETQNPFLYHSSLSNKKILDIWENVEKAQSPILVIGTASIFCLPTKEIGLIIIEEESSPYYKQHQKPFINTKFFASNFAKNIKSNLVFSDSLLSLETMHKYGAKKPSAFSPPKTNPSTTPQQKIVDMKKKKDFKILSNSLISLIKQSQEKDYKTFILASRRGISQTTICQDCERIVLCSNCNSHITLHKPKEEKDNFFLCHNCNQKRDALEKCKNCDSWNLKNIGIGIELIEEEIKKEFPKIKIFKIDKDTTKTPAQIKKAVESFYNTPKSILLGTPASIPYLKKVDNSAIVSIDSLLSIPNFNTNEEVLRTITKIREVTKKKFLIQTRDIEQPFLEIVESQDLQKFYKKEISQRKQFNYPPFGVIVKITIESRHYNSKKDIEKLGNLIKEYEHYILPTKPVNKNFSKTNIIIKIPSKNWVDENLLRILTQLPKNFEININPDNLN
ncbi:primosomal protein N' [Patescibacteria group bacterium]